MIPRESNWAIRVSIIITPAQYLQWDVSFLEIADLNAYHGSAFASMTKVFHHKTPLIIRALGIGGPILPLPFRNPETCYFQNNVSIQVKGAYLKKNKHTKLEKI